MKKNKKEESQVQYSGCDPKMKMDGEDNLDGGEHEFSSLIEKSDKIVSFSVGDFEEVDTAEGGICPYVL